jgi:hypothetical protein
LPLTPGSRIGVYTITAPIGEGGMGQVFRARDTKLDRDVAIKILPERFAHDADRLARFQREARTLAALNHANIAGIYGFEENGGLTALVMELVEGEDLSQRIARGAIPIDDALPIAKQIADALEAAHEQGIIHRDLKPANVKVRPDGTVKVLDFGLAKAMEPMSTSSGNAMNSPTLSLHATMGGVILGTAAYMSPEQARGKTVDKRADIWAFGTVLFEMLTGRRAFAGEDITDTIVLVVSKEPDWSALPTPTPVALRRVLKSCLKKDAKVRMRDIGEARIALDQSITGAPDDVSAPASLTAAVVPAWRSALPWAVVGALAIGLALVVGLWAPWRKASLSAPMRLSADLGADVSITIGLGNAMSLSPDGGIVAFVAQSASGRRQLYVRRLSQVQATPLSETDAAAPGPFFSPDGQWIAFFADGKLKKIATAGGAAVTLCDARAGRGGAWGEDGTIVFQPSTTGSLMRVSSAGGAPEPLTFLGDGEVTQRWPQVLPGGNAVLFTSSRDSGAFEDANLVVQSLPTGPRTVVQRGGYHGRYLPSGHLVYLHEGTLFAAPFDLDRRTVTGPPMPALESVTSNALSGGAQFAVSASGTLVYLPGETIGGGLPIHWMDHEGKTTPLRATPAIWSNLVFAPDGRARLTDYRGAKRHLDL